MAVITPDGIIEVEEMRKIFDQTYYSAMKLWSDWKQFGLPHGRGYVHEKPIVLTVLRIIDLAYVRVENWKLQKKAERN